MLLPLGLPLGMMQTKWKSILDILLKNKSLQSQILNNISLINGTTVINHGLGRTLVGWRQIGLNGAASIYDGQASNQTPEMTLILISNAAVQINLEVF
jgi:hypothetical protein